MGTKAQVVVLPVGTALLRVEEVDLPAPSAHQVLVRQFASGICHSQLHQIHGSPTSPTVLGHESTGVVLAAGSSVQAVREGDRVLVTWIPRPSPDGRQPESVGPLLADGTQTVCVNVYTWGDHALVDEAFVVPLPTGAPTDVTAIVGCAVMTGAGAVLRTADVRPGQSVAVFGVGGVGLSAIAAAAVVGADPIIAVDLDLTKLEMAGRFGATHLVDASKVDAVDAIRELTRLPGEPSTASHPADGVDFAFDCIGLQQTMEQIVDAARRGVRGERPGGMAVLVGVPTGAVQLGSRSIFGLFSGEKSYRGSVGGSCTPDRDFPMFLRWYEQKKLDLDALVTRRFSISEINEATTALEEGKILGRAIIEFES